MKYKFIIICLLLFALLVGIKLFFFPSNKEQNSQGKPKTSAPIPVSIFITKNELLNQEILVSGSLLANETATLFPEINGKLVFLNITEGESIEKGRLIAKINDNELQAQLKKINLNSALLQEKLNRLNELLKIKAISKEEQEDAQNNLESNLADAEIIKAQIEKTQIKAPFNGIIGLKNISEGAIVSTSSPIAELKQVQPIKIDFSIPEKYATLIKKNQTIYFTLNENPQKLNGKISAINPNIDVASRTIQIRAIADNSKGKLIPGSFANVTIPFNGKENSIIIPTQAVIPILKGKKVFVYKNGKAEEKLIKTGIRNSEKIQVLEGLSVGDSVISSGIMQIKQGSEITISKIK